MFVSVSMRSVRKVCVGLKPILIAFCVLISLASLWGCASKHRAETPHPEQALFIQAEEAFEKRAYDRAQKLYGKLARLYPKSASAPAALLKQGII